MSAYATEVGLLAALQAKYAILEAERDELKRDRDQLLKVLGKVQHRLEQMPSLLMDVNNALRGTG